VGESVSGRVGESRPFTPSPTHPLANLRSEIIRNKKPATLFGSGFVEIVVRRFSSACQRRKQVQRPATDVVVMPKPGVAVNIGPKHCGGAYTGRGTALSNSLANSANPPNGSLGILQVLSTITATTEFRESPKRQFGDPSSPLYNYSNNRVPRIPQTAVWGLFKLTLFIHSLADLAAGLQVQTDTLVLIEAMA
jgi:hypothetical protein